MHIQLRRRRAPFSRVVFGHLMDKMQLRTDHHLLRYLTALAGGSILGGCATVTLFDDIPPVLHRKYAVEGMQAYSVTNGDFAGVFLTPITHHHGL